MYDCASPGANFSRKLAVDSSGSLPWAGGVVRTPTPKRQAQPPVAPAEQRLQLQDISLKNEWDDTGYNERVKVLVHHAPSGSKLVWEGGSLADSQSVRALNTVQVDNYVRIDWVYETSECGSAHTVNMSKFVKLGAAGIEWVDS